MTTRSTAHERERERETEIATHLRLLLLLLLLLPRRALHLIEQLLLLRLRELGGGEVDVD